MILYWLVFLLLSAFAFVESKRVTNNGFLDSSLNPLWFFIIIFLTLFIGLRFQVGGDWGSYELYFDLVSYNDFSEIFDVRHDMGYAALNWIASKLGYSIYLVNFVCAFIFTYGLCYLCRSLPRPFLALCVSFPYLITVVAMGYTRQSVAIGLSMIAIIVLTKQRLFIFSFLILLAALFHKTALLLFGLAFLAASKNRFLISIGLLILLYFGYIGFLSESFELFYRFYVLNDYQSEGALVRVSMLLLPSLIFLIWPHRFNLNSFQKQLWIWFARISILLFVMLFVTSASTAIDRLALYFLPIQMIIFSYMPEIFYKKGELNHLIVLAIIGYYSVVLFVWLNFATFSIYWKPYSNYFLNFNG